MEYIEIPITKEGSINFKKAQPFLIRSKKEFSTVSNIDTGNLYKNMPQDCETHTETVTIQSCWFWIYSDGSAEIIDCYYHTETTTYQTCSGSGGGGGGGTTVIEEEVGIENNIENPCAALIFSELQLLSMDHDLPPSISNDSVGGLNSDINFSQSILNLFNDSDDFDYIVSERNDLDDEQSGYTDGDLNYNTQTNRYEINTYFNEDYFDEGTDLSMARSMIHESVHAYLAYALRNTNYNNNGTIRTALAAYIEDNGLSNQINNTLHHNFMAQFVDAMAFQLRIWDQNHNTGGNLGWQYYHDMAWGGLGKYRDKNGDLAFYQEYLDHTTAASRSRIEDVIENERNNTNNSSQNGNENTCQ